MPKNVAVVIQHHEPFPALVLDGKWNVVMANDAAATFFGMFVDPLVFLADETQDYKLIRTCLDDAGLAPFIVNWEELVFALLRRCRLASSMNPKDEGLRALTHDIVTHERAPAHWQRPNMEPISPVLDMTLEKDGRRWSLFTMLSHFGTPEHVTLQELSVETFYPADPSTKAHFNT